jgi:thiol-disulfide isomerase/thioredoxin
MSISRNRRGRFSSARSTKRKSTKSLDVTSKAHMPKLESLIKKMNLTIVLVYADWCGHCHTYKDTVWKKLEGMNSKKVGLAKLNEKAFADSPLSSAKINGYPSVLVVGKDGKPAEFKDESGDATNAMPNSRDMEMMKGLVRGTESQPKPDANVTYPKTIYIGNESNVSRKAEEAEALEVPELEVESKSLLNASPADDLEPETGDITPYNPSGPDSSNYFVNDSTAANASNSVNVNASPENADKNASAILVNSESPVSSKVLPPNSSDDLLDTVSGPENSSQLGGSLYMALLASAKATAPAAILTAAAAAKSKPRKTRRHKK